MTPPAPNFRSWLYRPYMDMGPSVEPAPLHTYSIEFDLKSLLEDEALPRIQAVLLPSYRDLLLRTTRNEAYYAVHSPLDLPGERRTPAWNQLCERVEAFANLSPRQRLLTTNLLCKLLLYRFVDALVPDYSDEDIAGDEWIAGLAYNKALSRYTQQGDDKSLPYSLDEFERIACHGPDRSVVKINALYQMVVQSVKHHWDVAAVDYWMPLMLQEVEAARDEIDPFVWMQLKTRYHRVCGFLPQMKGDMEGMVAEMEEAEEVARAMPHDTRHHSLCSKEMLFPVLESRIKEAFVLRDFDLARKRAEAIVELSPADPRGYLHFGQVLIEAEDVEGALKAYQNSVRYSPPGSEIAYFMIGQCYEAKGEPELACDAYMQSAEVDPLAISSVERLVELSDQLGRTSWHRWASARFDDLSREAAQSGKEDTSGRKVAKYKEYRSKNFDVENAEKGVPES